MNVHVMNNPAKVHADPIWNDRALDLEQQQTQQEQDE